MLKKMNLKAIEIIVTFISIIFCILAEKINGYETVFLIPITYFFCRLFTKFKLDDFKKNIGLASFEFLSFFKYSIMPLLIVIMKDYYGGLLTSYDIPSSNYVSMAIILSCIECISVHVVIFLFFKNKNNIDIVSKKVSRKIKINFPMLIFFVISILLIISFKSAFFPKQFFIISDDYQKVTIDSSVDGLIIMIFNIFKILILLLCVQHFLFKYNKNKKIIYIFDILLCILIYLGINTSTSRWSMVIPVVVVLFILKDEIFEKKLSKYLVASLISVMLISFVSISLYKFSWLFNDNASMQKVLQVLAGQIQEYVSGPRAIAQGIEAKDVYGNYITYQTLINDFAGSVPYFSKYVNQDDRINIYYNYVIKGTSKKATQIMPMISIGYAYFWYFGSSIFTIVNVIISLYFGKKAQFSDDILLKYMLSYFSIWCAMCLGFNTQIIFGYFVSTFLPFMLIYYLNKKIIIKR